VTLIGERLLPKKTLTPANPCGTVFETQGIRMLLERPYP